MKRAAITVALFLIAAALFVVANSMRYVPIKSGLVLDTWGGNRLCWAEMDMSVPKFKCAENEQSNLNPVKNANRVLTDEEAFGQHTQPKQ